MQCEMFLYTSNKMIWYFSKYQAIIIIIFYLISIYRKNLIFKLSFHLEYFRLWMHLSLEKERILKWSPNNFDKKQPINSNDKSAMKFLDQYMIDALMIMKNHYTFWKVSREHFHGIWQADFDDAEVKLCTNIEDLMDTWRIMESMCQMHKKNGTAMQLITTKLLQKRRTEDIIGEGDTDMQVLVSLAIVYNVNKLYTWFT